MKIRNGFVSNSSSSSFAVFGVSTNYQEIIEKLNIEEAKERQVKNCNHDFDRDEYSFCPHCGKKAWSIVSPNNIYEIIDEVCYKIDLALINLEGYSLGIYVGIHVKGLNGEEGIKTMSDVNKKIKEIFGREAEIYSGHYYS